MKEVKISAVNDTRSKAHIHFTDEEIKEIEKKALNKVKSVAKVDGFRKGKVPEHIIRQKFKGEIAREMLEGAIDLAVPAAAKESEHGLYSVVSLDKIGLDTDERDIEFTFDLPPVVKVKKLKDIQLKEHIAEITSEEIDKEIREYRLREATFSETEDAPEDGDRLTVDYEIWINGAPYGEEIKDREVRLGSGFFDPEMEAEMKSRPAKPGEEFKHEKNRPNNEGKEDKIETFVTVKKVEKANLPDLTDEFSKKVDASFETVEIMKNKLKENLEKRFRRRNISRELGDALNKLSTQVEYHFSESVIKDEKKQILEQYQLSEVPAEQAGEFEEAVMMRLKNDSLGRFLHNRALEKSGKSIEEELKEIITKEFGEEAANIGLQLLMMARGGKQPEGYGKQILDSYLQQLATEFNYRFFQEEGLIKKGKKLSLTELEKLYSDK